MSKYQHIFILKFNEVKSQWKGKSFSGFHSGVVLETENRKMSFGIAQIIVNMYLKFQWCLGETYSPPHFPLTDDIQEELFRHLSDEQKYERVN